MQLRTRRVRGLRLAFLEKKANGVGVLLIHGNSSSNHAFAKQIPALAAMGFSVVVPDLPGHGGSEHSRRPDRTYSFPGYADVLHSLMHELGYRSYHVVGWSLGGHIGLELLARYSAVRSLLITGTPPVSLNVEGIQKGFRWTPSTALAGKKAFSRDDAIRYVRAMMGTRSAAPDQLATALSADGNARYWMVRNGMAGVGADELRIVAEDERPLGIVQGRFDPFIRTEYLASLPYRNIWNGEPLLIDAGHAPHWEASATFNQHMKGFLNYASGLTNGGGHHGRSNRGLH
ncbi:MULTISPECIES: alpha/beta fold hydrolase [Bradyrhizobium]|uniref:alpha/beta fold hydrolase n=1 Tax=Bradyrhizobium TaxID=374 RepID=UPI0006872BE9|nr:MULTISPECIES: alpha/beta hydrolase [Bradyrhizobium]UFW51121.1 alpha/beta hydrolase [Bradyrhizobium arachidis]